jgi:hypothetical protein
MTMAGAIQYGNTDTSSQGSQMRDKCRAISEADFKPSDSMVADSILVYMEIEECPALMDDWEIKCAIMKRSDQTLICTTSIFVTSASSGRDWFKFSIVGACTLSNNTAYLLTMKCDTCDYFQARSVSISYTQPGSPVYYGIYESQTSDTWENPWTYSDSLAGRYYCVYVQGTTIGAATKPQVIFINTD